MIISDESAFATDYADYYRFVSVLCRKTAVLLNSKFTALLHQTSLTNYVIFWLEIKNVTAFYSAAFAWLDALPKPAKTEPQRG